MSVRVGLAPGGDASLTLDEARLALADRLFARKRAGRFGVREGRRRLAQALGESR